MREMLRRFDELLSEKVNKYTHKGLEEYVNATFLEKRKWEPIQAKFEEIRLENEKMLAQVRSQMKG